MKKAKERRPTLYSATAISEMCSGSQSSVRAFIEQNRIRPDEIAGASYLWRLTSARKIARSFDKSRRAKAVA